MTTLVGIEQHLAFETSQAAAGTYYYLMPAESVQAPKLGNITLAG
jgi:hypothetical protein